MENLILSFEVVAPLLILMLLGALMLRVHIIDDTTVKKMNGVVFKVFLPVLIFNNVYKSSVEDVMNLDTALYISAVYICSFIVSMLVVGLTEKVPARKGVMVQGICRSNFVIFGVPLCASICGEHILGKISVAVAIAIPVLNIFSVIVLEFFRGGKPSLGKMLKGVMTNPLIIASVLGIITLVSGIKLPSIIETSIGDVAKIATPLALVLLGASVNPKSVKHNVSSLITAVSGKLILIPLIGISVAYLIGMRGEDLAILIAAFASPTAVSSYPMALQMDGDGELAAQIVAFSTTFCIVTVFLWVFVLKQFNLI